MKRGVSEHLQIWLRSPTRKPLIVRGARQVGKTWLIRELARSSGRDLIEINFERDSRKARHFAHPDPRRIMGELGLDRGRDIQIENALLFLDEAQAAAEVLASLRWFAEELPALPVVAAGSLLDFALSDHRFSTPVGRVSYCHVGPMTFPEYLEAHQQDALLAHLSGWRAPAELSVAAHERAAEWFERFIMVGGMPACVAADASGSDARDVRRMQGDLVASYRDDFAKYAGRMDPRLIDLVLFAVAGSLGRKFVYARAHEGVKLHQAKNALYLLEKARLCHAIRHTAANGIPLGAEAKDTPRKALLVDIGIAHALLGTPAGAQFPAWTDLAPQVRGQLAEQIAGQQLASLTDDPFAEPALYYWQREQGRVGEIDFVAQIRQRIIPIESKAGAAGTLKSLHQFMFDKHLALAVRLDANRPTLQELDVKTTQGDRARYRLLSLPHFLTWKLPTLVDQADAVLRSP